MLCHILLNYVCMYIIYIYICIFRNILLDGMPKKESSIRKLRSRKLRTSESEFPGNVPTGLGIPPVTIQNQLESWSAIFCPYPWYMSSSSVGKVRHRPNGYLAQLVPSLSLAGSFRSCSNRAVLKCMFSLEE